MNVCTFFGRIGQEPKGDKVRRFSLAVDGYDFKSKEKKTDWIDMRYAGNCPLEQGQQIAVTGKLQKDEYEGKWYTYIWVDRIDLVSRPKGQEATEAVKDDDNDIPF